MIKFILAAEIIKDLQKQKKSQNSDDHFLTNMVYGVHINPTSGSNFLLELLDVKDAIRKEQRKNQQPQLY